MKKLLRKIILILLFAVIIFIMIPSSFENSLSFMSALLFSIIGIISILEITNELNKHSYSLYLIHWIFFFFFFFLAPIIQLLCGYNPWGIKYQDVYVIKSCILIIIWMIIYKYGHYLSTKIIFRIKTIKTNENQTVIHSIPRFIVLIIAVLAGLLLTKTIGLSNMFARKTSIIDVDYGSSTQMVRSIIYQCTRAAITFFAAVSILNYYKSKKGKLYLFISILLLLICCFPTSISRNAAADIYLGLFVILLYYKNIHKKLLSSKYLFAFIIGMIILFPAINAFRNFSFEDVNILKVINITINNISDNYLSGDYDAFSMIGNTQRYVNLFGITYGRQLLGSLLFYIPRSIWNTKPVGSGSMIFSSFGYSFTNVSCPLIAEGYINFGILGVLLFALFFGFITSKIDCYYWEKISKENINFDFIQILYPFLLPSYFFMLRGDLLSSFSYLFSFIITFYALYIIIKSKIVFSKN